VILPEWVSYTFLTVGLLASLFYGWKACDVFDVSAKAKGWAWRVHQFWFNLAGSLLGWAAAWFVARKTWQCLAVTCPAQLDWSDAALIAVAFVGVTGHLPYATAGVLQGIKELALKVAGLGK
jgi:hypothetical protein